MSAPLLSVVIPSYNHARYLRAAIDSVLAQDVELELLVGDDASTDESWAILQELTDPRLRIWRNAENLGAHENLHRGLAQARGRWLAILNSDDRFAPGRLAQCVALLEAGSHDLVGSDIRLIDGEGEAVASHWWIDAFAGLKQVWQQTGDPVAALLAGNVYMTTSNFVFSRQLWQQLAPFGAQRYVHDYDFLLRALAAGARLGWIDRPLLDYRLHDRNTISEQPLNANLEASALLREHLPALLALPGELAPRVAALNAQWGRIEGYEVEILRALQHEALVGKDEAWQKLVTDRDRWIAERDGWIAERDDWIGQRDALIADQTEQLGRQDAELQALRQRPLRSVLAGVARGVGNRAALLRFHWSRLDAGEARPVQRVNGFAAFRRLLENMEPAPKALSLDVFDTLLARCIEPPEWLHERVAALLAERLNRPQHQLLALRREVEQRLRAEAAGNGTDHECHFDDILAGWVEALLPTAAPAAQAELVQWLEEQEFVLECLALRAKPNALLFLHWARSRGLRILAVSDMYLGERHLRRLLDALGYAGLVDRIHVSSEVGIGKYSGRMFARVLAEEGLRAEEVVHLGDNFYSDALAPCRLGISGVFLDERGERRRRRRQQLAARMAAVGGVWPGRMLAEVLAERLHGDERAKRQEGYFRYGLEVLGPIFATFVLGLIERLRARPVDKLLFLARDGELFQRMYAQAAAQLGEALPAPSYAHVSRRVVASAAIAEGLDHARAVVGLYNPKQQGLASILKTYGLELADYAAFAAEHGFSQLDERLEDWEDPRLHAFLQDERVQDSMRAAGREARALLHDYFAGLGFFAAERVALVDIGWNATIQHFLEQAFAGEGAYPCVDGYYFAFMNGIHQGGLQHGEIEGLLLDRRRGEPQERAPGDFVELFEQGGRALHATTIGYRREGDAVVPVLKSDEMPDRIEELRCNPAIAAMQEGVLLCCEHFIAAHQLTGFGFEALKPYAQALAERAVVYPTPAESTLIGQLAHTEDFGHDHLLDLSAGSVGWKDFLRPRALAGKLARLPWPYAAFARFRTALVPAVARTLELRRRS